MINLVLPGGLNLEFFEPDGEADARALLQFIQMAISPFKAIFDIIETFQTIQEIFRAVVINPASISSQVDDFITQVIKLLQYIPQISAASVIIGGLQMTDSILAEMEELVTQVSATVTKKTQLESYLDTDPTLAEFIPDLDAQITVQLASLQVLSDGMAPLSSLLTIIGKLIGQEIAIDVFSCDNITNASDGITTARRQIERLLANL